MDRCRQEHKKFDADCLYCHDTAIIMWHDIMRKKRPELNCNRIVFPVEILKDGISFNDIKLKFIKCIDDLV